MINMNDTQVSAALLQSLKKTAFDVGASDVEIISTDDVITALKNFTGEADA